MQVSAKPSSGIPKKYAHISFKPPKGAQAAAKRGLELRKKNDGKGGTATGVARARDISNGSNVSPETVKRMKAFFDRHQKNKKASGGQKKSEDKGYIAWLLWGGDPGYSWAKKVVKQMEAADKKVKAEAYDPPSYMSIQNLEQIIRDAKRILSMVDPDDVLDGWVEDKLSQAKGQLNSVVNYMLNEAQGELVQLGAAAEDAPNLRTAEGDHTCANCKFYEDDHCTKFDFSPAPTQVCDDWVALNKIGAAKDPWDEKNPPGGGGKLSEEWKKKAKARAKKAGRKYPNQADNMWAMEKQNEAKATAAMVRAFLSNVE